MEAATAEIRADYTAKIEDINTQIAALQTELQELETKHEQDKAELIAGYNTKIADLQSYVDGKVTELNTEIKKNEKAIADLTAQHNQDKQALEDDYNSKFTELQNTLNTTKTNLEDDYNSKIYSLKNNTESAIEEINDEIADLEKQIEDLKTKHNEDNESINSQIANLQSQIDTRKQEIESLKAKETEDIASLTSSLNTAISNLNDSLLSQKTTLENDYNSKLETLESNYNTKIESLTAIVDADKATLVAFKDQYITDKAALEAALQNGLDTLKADYLAKVATINSTITSLTNDITTLENEMNQAIEDIQNDYNSKINALITRINALETVRYHTVTFNTNGGSSIASIQVQHGEKISKPADPTKTGYNFENWTYEGKEWVFFGYVVTENLTLDAKWSDPIEYKITYNLDGGMLSSSNPTSYTVEDDYTLISPTKTGYTFAGWKDQNNNSFTSITKGMTGNKVLTANWTINYYALTVSADDSANGTVTGSGTYAFGSSVTVNATPNENKGFKGWYYNNVKVSSLLSYTFIMPGFSYSLVGKFYSEEDLFNVDSKDYIYFGSYPQSIVSDTNIANELSKLTTTNSRGYYEYNGVEYAKQTTKIRDSSFTYSNGESAVSNQTRYFKVEPILWRVLSSDVSGNYTLLAESALNAYAYNSSNDNNYQSSEIRSWLNDTFYNQAFKTAEKGAILTTTVKNDASTTNSTTNSYACEDTQDKVYLLSYQDYINTSYGFLSSYSSYDSAKYCHPTDFAVANDCFYHDYDSYQRCCGYWTRSPSSNKSFESSYVDYTGKIYSTFSRDIIGVRPAITISL